MRPLPLWVRALRGVDRYAIRGFRLYEILRDELLLGGSAPALHSALTAQVYADERAAYLPGGARFEAGFFDWESMVLERLALPRRARILLGAAGGGRELAALLELGHQVVAFEPNEVLLTGAKSVAAASSDARVLRASLEHLIELSAGGTGPLASVTGPFDLVLLGWVSLSHLTDPALHVALLRAIHGLYPRAPVVASFLVRGETHRESTRAALAFRAVLRAARGVAPAPALAYLPRGGVVYRFSRDEIGRLASDAGYAVRHLDTTRDGYAIFEPLR